MAQASGKPALNLASSSQQVTAKAYSEQEKKVQLDGDQSQSSSVSLSDNTQPLLTDRPANTISMSADNIAQIDMNTEHFVTLVQDGQAYSIPLSNYTPMQSDAALAQNSCAVSLPVIGSTENNDNHQSNSVIINNPTITQIRKSVSSAEKDSSRYGYMSSGSQINKKPKYKIIPNISTIQKKQNEPDTRFKPIKVDNWGIFLIDRVQNYFKRKEMCDLTIRFPESDSQIEAHKLILCACSEMFANAEKNGSLVNGSFDMPPRILPQAMIQMVRFMYSGRLEVDEESFDELYKVAILLEMAVVVKMLEAQKNCPVSQNKKHKRKREEECLDPILEAKKFKKIEMKIKEEEMQIVRTEKMKNLQKLKQEQDELEKQRLPGKKLPIWIHRKIEEPNTGTSVQLNQQNEISSLPTDTYLEDHENLISSPPKRVQDCKSKESHIQDKGGNLSVPLNYKIPTGRKGAICDKTKVSDSSNTPVINTYQRRSDSEKPKIPRKLREMREHLMFEKILKTGSKNALFKKSQEKKDKTVIDDDVKDLGREHEERVRMIQSEDDDDHSDYFDNDAELPEEWPEQNLNDEDAVIDLNEDKNKNSSDFPEKDQPSEVSKDLAENETKHGSCEYDDNNETTDMSELNFDDALEEFAKEVEEEQAPIQHEANKPRRGRPPKNPSNPTTLTNFSEYTKSQQKVIQAVLEKNPSLLNSDKPVQIKVAHFKDGKKMTEVLTIKPMAKPMIMKPNNLVSKTDSIISSPISGGLKPLEKVYFSGKRGRPRKLKPGEVDPHENERMRIKENLEKKFPSIAKLVEPRNENFENSEARSVKDTRLNNERQEIRDKAPNIVQNEENVTKSQMFEAAQNKENQIKIENYSRISRDDSVDDLSLANAKQLSSEPISSATILVQVPKANQLVPVSATVLTTATESNDLPSSSDTPGAVILSNVVEPSTNAMLMSAPINASSFDNSTLQSVGISTSAASGVLPTSSNMNVVLLNPAEGQGGYMNTMLAGSDLSTDSSIHIDGGSVHVSAPNTGVSNELTHMDNCAQLVQVIDPNGQESGKYMYVMDLKNVADTSSNQLVLPFAPVLPGNLLQTGATSQISSQTASNQAVQHITIDQGSLIPVTIGGISGVLPAAAEESNFAQVIDVTSSQHQAGSSNPTIEIENQQLTYVDSTNRDQQDPAAKARISNPIFCNLAWNQKEKQVTPSTSTNPGNIANEEIAISPVLGSPMARKAISRVSIVPSSVSSASDPHSSSSPTKSTTVSVVSATSLKHGSSGTIQINVPLPRNTTHISSPSRTQITLSSSTATSVTTSSSLSTTTHQITSTQVPSQVVLQHRPASQVNTLQLPVPRNPENNVSSIYYLGTKDTKNSQLINLNSAQQMVSTDRAQTLTGDSQIVAVSEDGDEKPGNQVSDVMTQEESKNKSNQVVRNIAKDWDSDGES